MKDYIKAHERLSIVCYATPFSFFKKVRKKLDGSRRTVKEGHDGYHSNQ